MNEKGGGEVVTVLKKAIKKWVNYSIMVCRMRIYLFIPG